MQRGSSSTVLWEPGDLTGSILLLGDPQTLGTQISTLHGHLTFLKNKLGFHPVTGWNLLLPPRCITPAPHKAYSLLLACYYTRNQSCLRYFTAWMTTWDPSFKNKSMTTWLPFFFIYVCVFHLCCFCFSKDRLVYGKRHNTDVCWCIQDVASHKFSLEFHTISRDDGACRAFFFVCF